jgi:hypothetical protein
MNDSTRRVRSPRRTSAFVLLPLAVACSNDHGGPEPGVGGGGGTAPGTAGTSGMNGGSAGSGNSAGTAPLAGSTSTAGTSSGGSNAGGAPGAGGSTPSSGAGGKSAGSGAAGSSNGGAAGSDGGSGAAGSGGGSGAAGSDGGSGAAGSGGGGGSDGCATATLDEFAPDDEELAELFAEYIATELGTLNCQTSGTGGSRTITETIFVPPNTAYDGKGETLTADAAAMNCDLSEGEQAENQRPYFLLAPGASLKNVTITYPGCEGVHMMGDNVLENIEWVDAGEDAASVRSYFPGGDITIKGSEGHHAADKMFQFNAPCNVLIQDFVGSDMGKLVRQNGGTEFELHVDLNNVNVTDCVSAVVQSDSPLCFVRHHDLSYTFTGSGDKSDRVFRDIPPENVTEY